MSVHQTPSGLWFCKFYQDGKEKRKYFRDGKQAAIDYNASLGLGKTRKAVGVLFGTLAVEYMRAKKGIIADTTYLICSYRFKNYILPVIGDKVAITLTPAVIDEFVTERLKKVKRSTVRRDLGDIIAVLNFAVSRGRISHNPLQGYRKPKQDDERINPPSIDELNAILSHALPHLQRVILISIYCGVRPGKKELFNLKYKDVDLDKGTITIKSAKKGGVRYRELPLHKDFRKALVEWIRVDGINPELHLIRYNEKPIKKGVDGAWRAAKKAAGIERRIRLYDIRHFWATRLLTQGGDLRTVSRALGHASPTITLQVYSHTSSDILKKAIDTLPEFEINTPKKAGNVTKLKSITKR